MNALGISLLWSGLQATLFCLAGAGAYLVARRKHPAWGALVLSGVLAITVGIAALSVSPWPRWWTMPAARPPDARPAAQETAAMAEAATTRVGQPSPPAPADAASEVNASAANVDLLDLLSSIWGKVQNQLDDGRRADLRAPHWHWPAWLAAVMLTGMAIGLARALLGLIALVRLLRHTRPVDDPSLVSLLEQLRVQLGCRRPIELREMNLFRAAGSPAVVGWRRPMILLPAEWRSWSADARRGILAHETAHVAHGDFLKWLVAQVGVILHFYNPLVHWLASRLRLEQELAADACGAALAGGAKTYMTLLAQMALAQDQSRPLWAGRPFFPTRGTLMRRIEMLHQQRFIASRLPSGMGPAVVIATLAVLGLAVSGLRGPLSPASAAEQPAKAKASANAGPNVEERALPTFDDSYLPAETIAVMSLRPLKPTGANMLVTPQLSPFPVVFSFNVGPVEKDKPSRWEVEEVKAIVLPAAPSAAPPSPAPSAGEPAFVLIYRMRQPFKADELRAWLFGEAPDGANEATLHGRTCYRTASEFTGERVNVLLPDERTIVTIRERDMAQVLAADSTRHPDWYGEWQEIARRPIAVGFDSQAVAAIEKDATDPIERGLLSTLKETSLFFASLAAEADGLEFRASARCNSPEQAVATEQSAKAALGIALAAIPRLLQPSDLPEEFRSLDIRSAAVQTLAKLEVKAEGTQVRVTAAFEGAFVDKFAQASSAILARQGNKFQAKAKEEEKTHLVKLARLAAAFNAYHDEHGRYPPAAVAGPDGKTLHSWRVELLPYLGEQELFARYKLDEPWDGEHNKQLIKHIPDIYCTTEASKQGDSDYCVVTGSGTLFDGGAPASRESMTDSPSETILVVQAQHRVAWTQPEDIAFPPADDAPRPFRGRGESFHAAFADGSVRLVPRSADPAAIRPLFTKAGGDDAKLK